MLYSLPLHLVLLLATSPMALSSPILEPRVSATNIKCTDATAYGVSPRALLGCGFYPPFKRKLVFPLPNR